MVAGSRRPGPGIEPPADIDPRDLAPEVRSQLRTLSKVAADGVARHLIAAGRLVDEDPQAALQHARAARTLGSRVAVVREAVGETAYAAGEWAEAIAELRTARRMTGDDSGLPMIADSERALGRADRALRLAQSEEAQALGPAERAEMRIVEAGARRDLGQLDAALLTLQDAGLDRRTVEPWSARIWYAYADLLLGAGREDEAREWFAAAADADTDGSTDADERLLELDGIEILSDEDEADGDESPAGPEASVAEGDGGLAAPQADADEPEADLDGSLGEPGDSMAELDSAEAELDGPDLAGAEPESVEADLDGPVAGELAAGLDGVEVDLDGPVADEPVAGPGGVEVEFDGPVAGEPAAGLDGAEAAGADSASGEAVAEAVVERDEARAALEESPADTVAGSDGVGTGAEPDEPAAVRPEPADRPTVRGDDDPAPDRASARVAGPEDEDAPGDRRDGAAPGDRRDEGVDGTAGSGGTDAASPITLTFSDRTAE